MRPAASRARRALRAAPALGLALVVGVAVSSLAAGCGSSTPLPGGPPPEFEPGRELVLPSESAAPAPLPPPEPAPASGTAGEASGTAPPAPPPGSAPGGGWTSTDVSAPPVVGGAGDPVPADGRIGAKHLLVMYAGSRKAPDTVTRTRDEARKRAEECLARARAPGARWEKVVTECTDEPHGAARGGDLFTFPPHAMVPEFAKGVLDTKVGQLSGVVESPFGFHVILRTR